MLKPGTIIQNYEIIEPLFGGSMGLVYRVRHCARLTEHAFRTLDPQFAIDTQTRERFKKASLTRLQLRHPNIVTVQDVVEMDGVIAEVTDLVRGPSLAEILAHRAGHQYGLLECLKVVKPLSEALAYAHSKGVVHRGLQPDRIVMEQNSDEAGSPRPMVIDFDVPGILCSGTDLRRSPANFVMAPYMTPELARGEVDVDARADVFALGMLMWRMLSGRLPVNPMDLVSVMRVYAGEASIPSLSESRPSLPVAFRELVDSALSIDPEARPRDGVALQKILGTWISDSNEETQFSFSKNEREPEIEVEVIVEQEVKRRPTPPPIPLEVRSSQVGLPPITEREDMDLPGTVARVGGPTRIEEPTAFYRALNDGNSSILSTSIHQIVGKHTFWALFGGVVLALVALGGWYSQSTASQLPLKPLAVAQRATMTATVSASEVESEMPDVQIVEIEPDAPEAKIAEPKIEKVPVKWRRNRGPCKELIGAWEGRRRHFRVQGTFREKGRKCTAEFKLFEGDRFVGNNRYKVSMNEIHLMEGRGKTRLKAHRDNITGDHNCWFSIRPRSRTRYLGRGCGGKFDIRRL
jgi:serine/threonine protein kinase